MAHAHTHIQGDNQARAVKLAERALGTQLELERVAIENFRKLEASIQIRMLEHDSRTHMTSQEAVNAMMESLIVGCWDMRDRYVCMYVCTCVCIHMISQEAVNAMMESLIVGC
jgi:hypothetical protein